jgi:NADH-quinone oxidoreductase subunit N
VSGADLLVLSPLIILAATAVCVMLLAAFYRRHGAVVLATLTGLLLSFAALGMAVSHVPRVVTPLLVVDNYAVYFIGLILAASIALAVLASGYLERRSASPEEFYVLLVTATLGAAVLAASRHFASFFLGLELLSVPMFAMMAYPDHRWRPLEAGTKYLVLAGVSSSLLLMGMALVYSDLGTTTFAGIAAALAGGHPTGPYVLAGFALILAGLGFKLSLVPFHMWVADVYEGAPAPVSAFVATVSKGAVFALLLRYVTDTGAIRAHAVVVMLSSLAILSMLVGNLLALLQNNVKRVLAYSSVAHMGYLLVPLVAGGAMAAEAVGYYLAAYFVALVGAFGVVTLVSASEEEDAGALEDYRGLFWRRPWLAGTLTGMLLSLAGIPVTMGFVAKFYALAAGVNGSAWILVYALIIASAIGLYYYLRIAIALFQPLSEQAREATVVPAPFSGRLVVLVAAFLLLWLGVYPGPLVDLVHGMAATGG